MLKKWDIEDKNLNQKCINEVIARIQDINDPETVGMVAAQDIIDIVTENYGPYIHNRAIALAQKATGEKIQEIEFALDDLRQS